MFERSSRPSSARPRPSRVYSESTQFRVKHIAGNNNPAPPVLSYFCFSFIKSFYLLKWLQWLCQKKEGKNLQATFFSLSVPKYICSVLLFWFSTSVVKIPSIRLSPRSNVKKKPNSVERPGKKKLFLFYNILDDNVFHEWIEKTSK